ncbi:MAG: Mrp/NBP35 family ATP-binding protein [Dehalococcoidia bacterium]|uniref:Mrp/NBP35 family ATP-binding protein n=1 Tax=Candidatus Amarobacter glycogenicus TaxID=3140699 RepID=UPI001D21430C|nr:Mrp/NBP35 family ATP-binding protein [Dehalococcoidia bacterium]MBK6560050.1 Mrp/NBP35 family ATP-binding protein [Dehalococcoidia bacterium]MBK7125650.1 Mrp/NBP35 family ATP-binding protein [Dehalococcoidia bacterium]MBK7328541.1 Mrp/NBP35 family ATP-binding protein [Dehalococcoidia bacterium]MBK7724339.1 Mrp/NBP35 family ATP-binding protein [Dehalococcoidia bacterium]
MTPVSTANRDEILAALDGVQDPELHASIVRLGMIKDIAVEENRVAITVELTTPACPLKETIEADIRAALAGMAGTDEVVLTWGANVRSSNPKEGQKAVEGVRNIIAVASNKGGVGKSTLASNIAVALAKTGASVGLVDADITGPNLPTMFGLPQGLQAGSSEGLRPVERYGVKVVSIGFLLPKGTPVVWRGPMIGSAVRQLLHDVPWGDLDYLIIDLPPGTSDAAMSMAQEAPIAGVVIVSSPQDVSVEDAMKAVAMFEKLDVPVFGMVENFSYFVAPDTGTRYDIFGHGGAAKAADELGIDFLGEIPIEPAVREGADRGIPVVYGAPDSESAKAIDRIAKNVAARISVLQRMGR